MAKEKISILGCGWYGFALAKKLVENKYEVKGSTTSESKLALLKDAGIQPYLINFEQSETEYDTDFFNCDILFIAIPPKSKTPQLVAYATKINAILVVATKANVKQVVLISSTGVYEDGNFIVDETVIPQPNTGVGKALLQAENILINYTSFTSTIIRFAGLIGPERNLAKHFAKRTEIPNGLAPINLIHLTDCLGLSLLIIEKKAFGRTYHAVSPSHPTRQQFYTKACLATGLGEPKFLNECLAWKCIESKNVPEVLAYEYVFTLWDKYFETLTN